MKKENLKKVINRMRNSEFIKAFNDADEFDEWILNLTDTQIENFLSLDVNLDDAFFPLYVLLDKNLLNCSDYQTRVEALLKLKNGEVCFPLFENLCDVNFLNSKSFYKDVEMISKAETARYPLWVINDINFINSAYHDEDLELIVYNQEDTYVTEALAMVAKNIDSINSPYHQADMKLISTSNNDCLTSPYSYPQNSLNALAVNSVSLGDPYHLENMKILSEGVIPFDGLFDIMTDETKIKEKNYRANINALVTAKDKMTSDAIYYYVKGKHITKIFDENKKILDYYNVFGSDFKMPFDEKREYISDGNSLDYLTNLKTLNEINSNYVMHYVSLLMDKKFMNMDYSLYDLEILRNVTNPQTFMDLYKYMSNTLSLQNPDHMTDVELLTTVKNPRTRSLLLRKLLCEVSFKSLNRVYDIEYILRLNIDRVSGELKDNIYYYLFDKNGINDKLHFENLEKLRNGEHICREESLLSYLDEFEKKLDAQEDYANEVIQVKKKVRIFDIFKKHEKH